MTSTGNDIVALQGADAGRAKNERFYGKIISGPELALYTPLQYGGLPMEHFVWLLWSIKESVYKYQQRLQPALLFSPRKMVVKNICLPKQPLPATFVSGSHTPHSFESDVYYTSTIQLGDAFFHTRSIISPAFIHTVAAGCKSFCNIHWGIKQIAATGYAAQSKAVRAFLLNGLSPILKSCCLNIQKHPAGYPVLYHQSAEVNIPISFSHHGHFVAYSYVLGGQG